MKYQILIDSDGNELEEAVNNLLQSGWEPLGGLAISQAYDVSENRHYFSYAQAMIHRGKEE